MEKRHEVLHRFDLGHEWDSDSNNCLQKSEKILAKQETGILFLESCVKQTKPRGRIGIILPNGYLGNRSKKYTVMREWLLRECFLVSICSFTRFTFKSSGADVSASVVFLQKRDTPLKTAVDSDDYLFNVQLIQTVGWDVGKKNGKPTYKKNSLDGSYIIGNSGEKILDADFKKSLRSIRSGSAANAFTWLREGHDIEHDSINETSFSIQHILNDADLTMDPKRHNQKFLELRQEIGTMKHFRLGDVLESARKHSHGLVRISPNSQAKYTATSKFRTWIRVVSKHKNYMVGICLTEPSILQNGGDIFIGSVWGSVEKWCLIANDDHDYVVTNGCHRFRIKDGNENLLLDLVSFFCTNSFTTQMRALARGSDGLAEVTIEDTKEVLVPKITDNKTRKALKPFVDNLLSGKHSLHSTVNMLLNNGSLRIPMPEKRPNHTVLVGIAFGF